MSLPPPRYTLPSVTARARSCLSHSSPKLRAELIRQLKRLATMRKRSRFTETTRSAVSKSLKRITSALTKQSIEPLARVSALAKTSARIGVPKEFRSTFATCRARCNAAASATPGSSPRELIRNQAGGPNLQWPCVGQIQPHRRNLPVPKKWAASSAVLPAPDLILPFTHVGITQCQAKG